MKQINHQRQNALTIALKNLLPGDASKSMGVAQHPESLNRKINTNK